MQHKLQISDFRLQIADFTSHITHHTSQISNFKSQIQISNHRFKFQITDFKFQITDSNWKLQISRMAKKETGNCFPVSCDLENVQALPLRARSAGRSSDRQCRWACCKARWSLQSASSA